MNNENLKSSSTNSMKMNNLRKNSKSLSNLKQHQQQQRQQQKKKLSTTSLTIKLSILPSSTKKTSKMNKDNHHEKKINYNVQSKRSILKDIKNHAIDKITTVKQGITTFLTKSKSNYNYDQENYQYDKLSTPIKLYSPFTIESPTIKSSTEEEQKKRLLLRQQLFTSPKNQLKNDIDNLHLQINHLNLLSKQIIPEQYQRQNETNDEQDEQNEIQSTTTKRLLLFRSNESLI